MVCLVEGTSHRFASVLSYRKCVSVTVHVRISEPLASFYCQLLEKIIIIIRVKGVRPWGTSRLTAVRSEDPTVGAFTGQF